jgi:hypothetical protein
MVCLPAFNRMLKAWNTCLGSNSLAFTCRRIPNPQNCMLETSKPSSSNAWYWSTRVPIDCDYRWDLESIDLTSHDGACEYSCKQITWWHISYFPHLLSLPPSSIQIYLVPTALTIFIIALVYQFARTTQLSPLPFHIGALHCADSFHSRETSHSAEWFRFPGPWEPGNAIYLFWKVFENHFNGFLLIIQCKA